MTRHSARRPQRIEALLVAVIMIGIGMITATIIVILLTYTLPGH